MAQFEMQGFCEIPAAISELDTNALAERALAAYYASEVFQSGSGKSFALDAAFLAVPEVLGLVDNPRVLPLVIAAMEGDNIRLMSSQLLVRPPRRDLLEHRFWHVDGPYHMYPNVGGIAPLTMIKALYALSDVSSENCGNFTLVPGSHRAAPVTQDPSLPDNERIGEIRGGIQVRQRPGDAVLFHQGLWHTAGNNRSARPRVYAVVAYTFAWAQPFDYDPGSVPDSLIAALTHSQRRLLQGPPGGAQARWYGRESGGWYRGSGEE